MKKVDGRTIGSVAIGGAGGILVTSMADLWMTTHAFDRDPPNAALANWGPPLTSAAVGILGFMLVGTGRGMYAFGGAALGNAVMQGLARLGVFD